MNNTILSLLISTTLLCSMHQSNAQSIMKKITPSEEKKPVNLSEHLLSIQDILAQPNVVKANVLFPSDSKKDRHLGFPVLTSAISIPLPQGIDMMYYQPEPQQFGTFLVSNQLKTEELQNLDRFLFQKMIDRKERRKFYRQAKKGNTLTIRKDEEKQNYILEYNTQSKVLEAELKWLLNSTLMLENFHRNRPPEAKPEFKKNYYLQKTI